MTAPLTASLPEASSNSAVTPIFTVLIDTYNYAHYIEDAVRSVLAQNFPAELREILVVDDGSTDDTEARLAKFGDAIRYFKKANGGQASAFNFGLQHARGEYVALLDADDVWLPDKLQRIYQAFQNQPDAGMAYHRLYQWTNDGSGAQAGEKLSTLGHFIAVSGRVTDSRFSLLCYPMMQTSSLVFRRAAMQDLLPVPEVLRTQADAFLTALIIFICPVVAVDEYLAKYRLHGANQFHGDTRGLSRMQLENRAAMRSALISAIRDWLRRHGIDCESANIRDYLRQWEKAQEVDRFALQAPNSWQYFRHLVEFPVLYRELMTGRELIYNYARSFAALLLGYGGLHHFDEFYARRKNRAAHLESSREGRENGDAAR
jgi:glycosyltransferase involved in cell wall biosynthesis